MNGTKIIFAFAASFILAASCRTVDMEKNQDAKDTQDSSEDFFQPIIEIDRPKEENIVYIERPVYMPAPAEKPERKTGKAAVVDSLERATVRPEHYKNGTFYYQYNEDFVYEIYAQTFHLTDIILEPGEALLGQPLFSEDDSVWELTAEAGKDSATGEDVQHLYVKPAYSGLDSTLIINTNRRVYHFTVKSFKDTHMAMVKFTYPQKRNTYVKPRAEDNGADKSESGNYVTVTNPEFLSFNYKVKYNVFRKPDFKPKMVYDDGRKTYVQVDDIVLQKKLPLCFDNKNEIMNYSAQKNTFIIPRLIDKITLRLGKDKATIVKKKSSKSETRRAEALENE